MFINVSREILPGGEDVDMIVVPVAHPNRQAILDAVAEVIDEEVYSPAAERWGKGDDTATAEKEAASVAIDRLRNGNQR